MASSIILAVKSVFDDAGLKKAQKDFGSVGKKLKGVLAGVGIGVGLSAAVSALKDAGKAAVTDAKSQAVLANALKNTLGASDDVIKSVEANVNAWQLASGVADDQLRPAYTSLATATGSVTQANSLMQTALDLAARKQISVEQAANAMAKAYRGNGTQLKKLMPELTGSTNLMGDLAKAVKGASDAAAATDPFSRINVIFGELQEQIGTALIPYMQQLATYLASPEGQIQMQKLADTIAVVVVNLANTVSWLIENATWIGTVATIVGTLAVAWVAAEVALAVYTATTKGAAIAQAILAIAQGAINPFALAVGILALGLAMTMLGEETGKAADEQERLNNESESYTPPKLPIYTGSDREIEANKPKNPQPGTVYTWYRYEKVDGVWLAVWYEQVWNGKTWSAPKKKTYVSNTTSKVSPFTKFTNKLADDAKKLRAIGVLTGKGLSESFAEAIVNSGDDWMTVYNKIVNSGAATLKKLQAQWNATEKGQDELADAKKAAYEKQKALDEEYADSVKETFSSIRDSIMGAFDITQMGKTAGGLLRNVNKLIAQTKAFADNIRSLAGQNLNPQLLNQLIMAGPMEGGRLAASLAASGAGVIGDLNTGYSAFQGLSTDIAAYGTLSQFGDKANPVINVTVNAGMGTDGAAVGKQVVDAILKYERTTGKIFARA